MTMAASMTALEQPPVLLGGSKSIADGEEELFQWPVVTEEDEQAVLEVLRSGTMSRIEITRQFESEFAAYIGTAFSLAYPNGTMALLAAMYAVGVRRGDEIIVPSITFWSSAMPAFSLGATVVFADIDLDTLCLDPADIERWISPRTKAIMPVHYFGHPCDMDAITAVARKHDLKIIEDCSHSHGSRYQGRMTGTLGDVSVFSLMTGKGLAIGEGGVLCTDDRGIIERAAGFGNYARHEELLAEPELKANAGVPWGGVKGRMNQMCAALGRVQLKHFPERLVTIERAMTRFWDCLAGVPGIRPHRTRPQTNSTMGAWYHPVGLYDPEQLNGLPSHEFMAAVNAEGVKLRGTCNFPLHLHPVFNELDVYGDGRPTRNAFSDRDVRQPKGTLPRAEIAPQRTIRIPWFKHDRAASIERYAGVYRKIAMHSAALAEKVSG